MWNFFVGRLSQIQPTHVSTALRSYLYTYLCACENAGFLNVWSRDGPGGFGTALRTETAGLRAECEILRSDLTTLQADHDDLAAAQAPPAEPIRQPPPAIHPKISLPDKWDGSGTKCDVFLTNLNLVFEFQPSRYPTDRSRIALLTSLLTGQTAEWATAVLKADGDIAHSYPAFTTELRTVFQHPESEVEVDSRLYHLKQGSRSVSRYTTEFRTLAVTEA
ncbi:Retrotransposon-derived protein PEG10 [Labeo rohita]|uniref:Retrotransposon-derived protein PEG10 n=1 Tax=Labeo rohita TaxID=84645 RepID=A0ABQ8LA45_LABRO|nr:Retrotransposon-derived protein PEG10 [Labeo rohita]